MAAHLDREFVTIYFMQGSPEKHKIAVRRIYLVLGLIGFVFLAVFLRVWQEMRIMNLGYQLNHARQEYRKLTEAHRLLLSRRNALANLDRVESLAKNELGLRPPQSEQLIFLADPGMDASQGGNWLEKFMERFGKTKQENGASGANGPPLSL